MDNRGGPVLTGSPDLLCYLAADTFAPRADHDGGPFGGREERNRTANRGHQLLHSPQPRRETCWGAALGGDGIGGAARWLNRAPAALPGSGADRA
jgi:hypothetical protein